MKYILSFFLLLFFVNSMEAQKLPIVYFMKPKYDLTITSNIIQATNEKLLSFFKNNNKIIFFSKDNINKDSIDYFVDIEYLDSRGFFDNIKNPEKKFPTNFQFDAFYNKSFTIKLDFINNKNCTYNFSKLIFIDNYFTDQNGNIGNYKTNNDAELKIINVSLDDKLKELKELNFPKSGLITNISKLNSKGNKAEEIDVTFDDFTATENDEFNVFVVIKEYNINGINIPDLDKIGKIKAIKKDSKLILKVSDGNEDIKKYFDLKNKIIIKNNL